MTRRHDVIQRQKSWSRFSGREGCHRRMPSTAMLSTACDGCISRGSAQRTLEGNGWHDYAPTSFAYQRWTSGGNNGSNPIAIAT